MAKKLQPVRDKSLNGPKIHILDVTNRDGVQTSRLGLAKLQKTMINMYLDKMGVYQSELGFPFTNHEINYINANLELKRSIIERNLYANEIDQSAIVIAKLRLIKWLLSNDLNNINYNIPNFKSFKSTNIDHVIEILNIKFNIYNW